MASTQFRVVAEEEEVATLVLKDAVMDMDEVVTEGAILGAEVSALKLMVSMS